MPTPARRSTPLLGNPGGFVVARIGNTRPTRRLIGAAMSAPIVQPVASVLKSRRVVTVEVYAVFIARVTDMKVRPPTSAMLNLPTGADLYPPRIDTWDSRLFSRTPV